MLAFSRQARKRRFDTLLCKVSGMLPSGPLCSGMECITHPTFFAAKRAGCGTRL